MTSKGYHQAEENQMAGVGRQSHLTLHKGDPIVKIRMDCMNRETMMTDYFEKLKYVL